MPAIQPYSELRGVISAIRDILSNASSTLTSLHEIQASMEGQNADTSLIYNILRPKYDTLADTLAEAAQEILATVSRPEIHCKVGWPSSYTTNAIVASAAPPAVADSITADGTAFGGFSNGDIIEILTAEDAANERLLALDDTPGATVLYPGFTTVTANAADTVLELKQRGILATCQIDATKVAATTLTTNAKGSGVCSITGMNGTLCGLSVYRDGAVDKTDILVISKRPIAVIDSFAKAGSAIGVTVTTNGLVIGDLARVEGLSDAGWTAMNGHTFK